MQKGPWRIHFRFIIAIPFERQILVVPCHGANSTTTSPLPPTNHIASLTSLPDRLPDLFSVCSSRPLFPSSLRFSDRCFSIFFISTTSSLVISRYPVAAVDSPSLSLPPPPNPPRHCHSSPLLSPLLYLHLSSSSSITGTFSLPPSVPFSSLANSNSSR